MMLIENKRFDEVYPVLDPSYADEADKLEELHQEVSVVAFEQEREIIGRIEIKDRYTRSRSILLALLALGGLYGSYCYLCPSEIAKAAVEGSDILPLIATIS